MGNKNRYNGSETKKQILEILIIFKRKVANILFFGIFFYFFQKKDLKSACFVLYLLMWGLGSALRKLEKRIEK